MRKMKAINKKLLAAIEYLLGQSLAVAGHYQQSYSAFSEATEWDCHFTLAWFEKGKIALKLGMLDEGETSLLIANRCNSELAIQHPNLFHDLIEKYAAKHSAQKDYMLAFEYYTQLMTLRPEKQIEWHLHRLQNLELLIESYVQNKQIRLLRTELKRYFKLDPKNSKLRLVSASLYEHRGNTKEAIKELRRALKWSSDPTQIEKIKIKLQELSSK